MDSVHKAKSGHAQGRILTVDVKDAGLQKEDRLEPAAGGLCNWKDLHGDRAQGAKVVFWRTSSEWMTKHRNPLFQGCLGSDVFNGNRLDAHLVLGDSSAVHLWIALEDAVSQLVFLHLSQPDSVSVGTFGGGGAHPLV